MKMPFGRWRNFEIEDVPPEYLAWLLKKTNLHELLRGAVAYELDSWQWERRNIAAAIEERVGTL